jgi:autotransporter strand-loop-strand O-heptosyltransferase
MPMSVVSMRQKDNANPASELSVEVSASPEVETVEGEDSVASKAAEGVAAASDSAPQDRPTFPRPAEIPTQTAVEGVRFDFNDGCRLLLPKGAEPWRVRLSDIDTGNILYETKMDAGRVNSAKRYFIRGRIELWRGEALVYSHDYCAADREVLINFPVGTLGDTIAWFPYAVKFKEAHGCRLTCAMAAHLIPLFQGAYPEIEFVPHKDVRVERYYAAYNMGLFFDDKANVHQPCDFRLVGLHRTAGYILGVDPSEAPPRLALVDDSRPIAEPYVCIATQATTQAKYWNNPQGWREIIRFLKDAGYRVICIDQKPAHGVGLVWNHIPNGAEDETGDRPLLERVRRLGQRPLLARLGGGDARRDDQRFLASGDRIRDALARDQLPHLQQLLERPGLALRPQGLFVVPAAQGHAAAVRMHEAHHGGAGEAGDRADAGVRGAVAERRLAGALASRDNAGVPTGGGSMSVAFDRLKLVERLEAGGFTHGQAKAAAEAWADAAGRQLATKRDLKEVEASLRAEIAARRELAARIAKVETRLDRAEFEAGLERLKATIDASAAGLKADILSWLVATQIGLAVFTVAVLKFVR